MCQEKKDVGIAEKFTSKYSQKLDRTGNCWLWTGKTTETGYVRLRWQGKKTYLHRLAYTVFKGTIPNELIVDHVCRIRQCCNPEHLRLVTVRQNAENQALYSKRSSSGYRGVSWSIGRNKWATHLTYNGKAISLGRFPLYELHVAAYYVMQKRLEVFTHNEEDKI